MLIERQEMVTHLLSSLSSRDREILRRFYLEEQSREQICSEMRLTETQFRLFKSRAKARFSELGQRQISRKRLSANAIQLIYHHGPE